MRRTIWERFCSSNPRCPPNRRDAAMTPIVVIPARMASTRLPGKPLADIHGRPMIVHVLDRAREAASARSPSPAPRRRSPRRCARAGGIAVLTDPSLPVGLRPRPCRPGRARRRGRHDVVVNLQGDLPTIPPAQLRAVLAPLADPAIDIAHPGGADRRSGGGGATPSVVKAACAFERGRAVSPALYFSRAPIPWGDGPRWHHIGIYAYRRAALARFVALPPIAAGAAREAGAVAGAGGGHADRLRARRSRAVRRRYAGRPRTRAPLHAWRARMTRRHRLPGPCPAPIPTWPAAPPIPDVTTLPCDTLRGRRSRRCARAARSSPCCPARTASPAACPTSTICCRNRACSSWASTSSASSTACWRRAAPRSRA